ncbi:MAG: AMP-binding protein [Rhodoferax sp.]|nr:AMP-binding protein [Rhodoferax sp.]
MTPGQASGLVHGPLAEWALSRADATAIASGHQRLTFAELHAAVALRAQALAKAQAPATVLVDSNLPLVQRLVDFLGINASGRCAAVADPDWPAAVRDSVQAALPQTPCSVPAPQPLSPFYVGYTSGSTGVPKGFRRHHLSWAESFRVCLQEFGPDAAACILAPGRDAHSLFLFGMLLGLWTGGGVVVQERFSASAALDTLRSGQTPALITAPSQLLLMLDMARHKALAPIAATRLIMISGARWMRHRTSELRALFPQARIVEFYGASETSFIAWMDTDDSTPAAVVGRAFANVELQIRTALGEDAAGLIYVRSPMLFMDYVGVADDATAALRDGDWLSVRDLGVLDDQGRLSLAGRQNRMIVTQGKNLFAEELEAVLEAHPAVALASVHGVEDERRGAQVVGIVQWATGPEAARPEALLISAWCKQSLEAFKTPRKLFVCSDWPRTVSGKTDHARLGQMLRNYRQDPASTPCLSPLP